jgi:hypothetical protein
METRGQTRYQRLQTADGRIQSTRLLAVALTVTAMLIEAGVGAYGASVPPGTIVGHQTHCFTMTPFEDELRLESALIAPPTVGFSTFSAQWRGGRSYLIEGAGDGQVTHNGTRVSVSLVFFNHTELASRNRWGRFAASIHLSTLKGPWALSITGDGRPEGGASGTPYSIQGFLVPKPCSQVGKGTPGDPPNLVLAPAE